MKPNSDVNLSVNASASTVLATDWVLPLSSEELTKQPYQWQ
ncbi:hypothetical protein [Lacticaseibacillus hegangensis]|uniref:Uncharacterized protein n=1 Tax=Lacticaseibacillus hegangensis TaxID=2486010 RepID=A0ABW4D100_9LACO|nr:hypothetical protein [Lacticaseibacillus hegangensis]